MLFVCCLFFIGGEDGLSGDLLLLSCWNLAVSDGGGAFQGTYRARGYANTLTIDADGLQIHVLFALGSDVGVATGIGRVGALARELVDARHRNGRKISRALRFCKEGRSVPL